MDDGIYSRRPSQCYSTPLRSRVSSSFCRLLVWGSGTAMRRWSEASHIETPEHKMEYEYDFNNLHRLERPLAHRSQLLALHSRTMGQYLSLGVLLRSPKSLRTPR